MPVAEPAYTSAQPTLDVAGRVQESLADGLMQMQVREHSGGLYRCEATFGNWGRKEGRIDHLHFDRRTLDFGAPFRVGVGGETVFEGRITALEAHFLSGGHRSLTVLAEDRLQDLRMTRRSRSFERVTDADVVTRVARDHGLTPRVSLQGPSHRLLVQVDQSDLAFLRERARAVGAELWLEGTDLWAAPRSDRGRPGLELAYQGKLHEFCVLADLSHQCSGLVVSGWDVDGKQAIREAVGDGAIGNELGGASSGASLLASALGERVRTLVCPVPVTAREARVQAEAAFRDLARRFVVGRGVAEPDGRLRVGASVDLQGLGELFNGSYYVSETTYRFDRIKGGRTEFVAERPGIGQ